MSPHCHVFAGKGASDEVDYLQRIFKATLLELFVYFGYSPRASSVLAEAQMDLDMDMLKVLKVAETRWLSMGEIGTTRGCDYLLMLMSIRCS